MDLSAELVAPCAPEELFGWVQDLGRYPSWLEIVTQAQVSEDGSWAVDLRGRVGPLARTKRLRMVRTELVEPTRAVFERAELDGRQHSAWTLVAEVAPDGDGDEPPSRPGHNRPRSFEQVLYQAIDSTGAVTTEVDVALPGGTQIVATVTRDSAIELGLGPVGHSNLGRFYFIQQTGFPAAKTHPLARPGLQPLPLAQRASRFLQPVQIGRASCRERVSSPV